MTGETKRVILPSLLFMTPFIRKQQDNVKVLCTLCGKAEAEIWQLIIGGFLIAHLHIVTSCVGSLVRRHDYVNNICNVIVIYRIM